MPAHHGTRSCYDKGCREEACRAAKSAALHKQRGTEAQPPAWSKWDIAPVPDEAFTRSELLAFRGMA